MIPIPSGTQIWVACGATDMRRGFDGLAMMVQDVLKRSPYCGHLFVFREASRQNQGSLVGRHGLVSVCETAGARTVCLAVDAGRRCSPDAGTIVDAVRGN
jgi:IS66 Orf2 like protein